MPLDPVPVVRNLFVHLTAESAERVRSLAIYPEVRGDHVTLAHGVPPGELDPAWIPEGRSVGEPVSVRAVGLCHDERVQALVVEIGGSSRRPLDGATLHVTVSRQPEARSRDANQLPFGEATPIDLRLDGVIAWDDG